MVESYWQIGQLIVEEEQNGKERADYGPYLIAELSKRLTVDFGKGFTETNLRYMRMFFLTFPIRHALRDELTWTHYRLLTKVENERARTFYLTEAIEARWSTRQLERQINSFYYERILSSRERLELRADENRTATPLQPIDIIKDPYSVLEGSEQLFASKYKLYLPTEEELARELRRELEAIQTEKGLE